MILGVACSTPRKNIDRATLPPVPVEPVKTQTVIGYAPSNVSTVTTESGAQAAEAGNIKSVETVVGDEDVRLALPGVAEVFIPKGTVRGRVLLQVRDTYTYAAEVMAFRQGVSLIGSPVLRILTAERPKDLFGGLIFYVPSQQSYIDQGGRTDLALVPIYDVSGDEPSELSSMGASICHDGKALCISVNSADFVDSQESHPGTTHIRFFEFYVVPILIPNNFGE